MLQFSLNQITQALCFYIPTRTTERGLESDMTAHCWIFILTELLRMCSMLHLASLFHTNQRVSGLGYYSIEEAIDFKYGT